MPFHRLLIGLWICDPFRPLRPSARLRPPRPAWTNAGRGRPTAPGPRRPHRALRGVVRGDRKGHGAEEDEHGIEMVVLALLDLWSWFNWKKAISKDCVCYIPPWGHR